MVDATSGKDAPEAVAASGAKPAAALGAARRDALEEDWTAWARSTTPAARGLEPNLEALLAGQSTPALWAEVVLITAAVAAIDFVTGPDLNVSIFYLVPVIFATWFLSRRAGIVIAVLSVAAWASIDLMAGAHYASVLVPAWNSAVRLGSFLLVLELVHLMKEAKAREARLARVDSLTGVANGRSFSDRASLELASMRRSGRPMTLAYIDLDHFKDVNDTVGHTEGDRLLRTVAHAIADRLRTTDLVSRLGGDEFGVLLPNTDEATAPEVLVAIDQAIRHAVAGQWEVGCTIGAVTFVRAPESVDFMVRAADELMYRGKRGGRGRIERGVWPPAGLGNE